METRTEEIVDVEPWPGFDDAVIIWMALVTERERLKHVIETRRVCEPTFGAPRSSKFLMDVELDAVKKKLTRVAELAVMVLDRRRKIAAALVEEKS